MSTLVGVPVKDCAIWLNRFLDSLEQLTDVSRAIFYYGKGRDPTLPVLKEWAEEAPFLVEIYEDPPMRVLSSAQIAPVYRELQEAMREGDETHFLGIDADIMKMPNNLITRLKKSKKDIIAPYVYVENLKPKTFYDTNNFRYKGCRFHPFSPPTYNRPFQVESVGTCWLASREAFTETDIDNPYPDRNFCNNARDKEHTVWVDPRLSVYHLHASPLGLYSVPLEALQGKEPDPTPYIKANGTVIEVGMMPNDFVEAYVWGRVEE